MTYNCDNCLAKFADSDKYNQLRCDGDCHRNFCMKCTGLNKTTTKALLDRKCSHLKFLCTLCDLPSLRYFNEKIENLSKNQIPIENVEALTQVTKKLTDNLPVFIETYELLTKNDDKLDYLIKKIDEIHKLNCLLNPERILKSVRQMEHDIYNISSVFFGDSDETIKVQIQDSNVIEIKLGLERLSSHINEVSNQMSNLTKSLSTLPTKKEVLKNKKVTSCANSSTQTEKHQHFKASQDIKAKIPDDKYHFVVISNLSSFYTPVQVVHYIKEKLGIKEYIRCYALLKDAVTATGSSFKIGLKSKTSINLLFNKDIWPAGVNIEWSIESSYLEPMLTSESHVNPKIIRSPVSLEMPYTNLSNNEEDVQCSNIRSDKQAIEICKSANPFHTPINFIKKDTLEPSINLDPLTPPRVRLTNNSNSRYILARLREPDILKAIKLFLAFLHDQPASVFFDGFTNTSVKLFLASEGLPTKTEELRKILLDFNDAYGIGPDEVDADLAAFRSYLTSERINHLQLTRECYRNYYSAVSPRRNF